MYLYATAIVLLLLTVLTGAVLAFANARKKKPPITALVLHGTLAVTSLVFLAAAETIGGGGVLHDELHELRPTSDMIKILFMTVALFGLVMLMGYTWRRRQLPLAIALAHVLFAVLAIMMLLLYGDTIIGDLAGFW